MLFRSDFGSRPDLILVDGGRGHVATARQLFNEMGIEVAVAGMVKDERHRTRGLALLDGSIVELRPSRRLNEGDYPPADETAGDLGQPEQLALLRLLTAIQDEAHRFAGQYRSKLHKKRSTRFSLEGIRGIGPNRRRLLLQQFQTIKGVSAASLAELESLKGLGSEAALAVFKHFHPEVQ